MSFQRHAKTRGLPEVSITRDETPKINSCYLGLQIKKQTTQTFTRLNMPTPKTPAKRVTGPDSLLGFSTPSFRRTILRGHKGAQFLSQPAAGHDVAADLRDSEPVSSLLVSTP